jgi:hypothetical protein
MCPSARTFVTTCLFLINHCFSLFLSFHQDLKPHQWARVPNQSLQVHAPKLSDIRGWSTLCEDAVSVSALHIPEEDRHIDILELIETERMLR